MNTPESTYKAFLHVNAKTHERTVAIDRLIEDLEGDYKHQTVNRLSGSVEAEAAFNRHMKRIREYTGAMIARSDADALPKEAAETLVHILEEKYQDILEALFYNHTSPSEKSGLRDALYHVTRLINHVGADVPAPR